MIGITETPIHRFDYGYYIEVEVTDVSETEAGCMGLGITFMRPGDLARMPKRLEKLKQGWFFTGPYKGGTTRRVYRHGKKDIRFILDGEEKSPLRWSVGDKMSLLVRPKDYGEAVYQWTISLYINRNIVLACTIDVPPVEDGTSVGDGTSAADAAEGGVPSVPKHLELYACAEAYGYVTGVAIRKDAIPSGLAIAGSNPGGGAEQ